MASLSCHFLVNNIFNNYLIVQKEFNAWVNDWTFLFQRAKHFRNMTNMFLPLRWSLLSYEAWSCLSKFRIGWFTRVRAVWVRILLLGQIFETKADEGGTLVYLKHSLSLSKWIKSNCKLILLMPIFIVSVTIKTLMTLQRAEQGVTSNRTSKK